MSCDVGSLKGGWDVNVSKANSYHAQASVKPRTLESKREKEKRKLYPISVILSPLLLSLTPTIPAILSTLLSLSSPSSNSNPKS